MHAYALGLNHGSKRDCSACPGCVSWFSTNVTARTGFHVLSVRSNSLDRSKSSFEHDAL